MLNTGWADGVVGLLLATALRASVFVLVALGMAVALRRDSAMLRRRL